jgi:hypothetical protein
MKSDVLIVAADRLLDPFVDRMIACTDEALEKSVGRKTAEAEDSGNRPTGYIVHDFPSTEVRR